MHEQLPVDSSLESLATSSLCTDQTDFTITSYREPEYCLNIDFPGGSIVVVWIDASDLDLCLLVPNTLSFDSIFKAQMGQCHFEPCNKIAPQFYESHESKGFIFLSSSSPLPLLGTCAVLLIQGVIIPSSISSLQAPFLQVFFP